MPDLIGHTLGQYRIIEHIGLGGMATVYKAYQPALDRYVAVKVLPAYYAHEPGFAERFIREAKAVAKLTHPHVLPIYDFGQEDELSYIVMQYVGAGTLKDMLGQPISLTVATEIIEQIAEALDYAHERGIIHRDVKPSNVLMDRGRWALLSDFGLAKMVEGSIQLTGSGVGVGTPAYMAPEQGQGLKVDRRADIYSLGIILYEMVTGRVPFSAETPMAVVVKHITEPLPLPHTINPNLPEGVERIILKALAKSPDDRYETAGKMAAALRKVVAGLDTALAEAAPAAAAEPVAAPTILEEGGATQVVAAPIEAAPPQPARKRHVPKWAIGVAVALALVTLFGFCALAGRKQAADRATQTAVAQVAIGAPTVAVGTAATPAAPSPAETPPSPSPMDALPEPVKDFIKQNPPVFRDDFSDPKSGWKVASDERGMLAYEDGAYVMRVPEVVGKKNITSARLPFYPPLTDFALQVDLTHINGGAGSKWAVTFRALQANAGLYAGLSAQPRGFGIGRVSPEGETPVERRPVSSYKPFQTTQVMVVAIGPEVTLFLDGQRVGMARVDLIQPGQFFITVANEGDPMVAYRLDNVRLWDLGPLAGPPSGEPVPPASALPVSEDFTRADRWSFAPEDWKIVQEENGNPVLQSSAVHGWAIYKGGNWQDIHLRFRMKSLSDKVDLLVNFRGSLGDVAGRRYMVHFVPGQAVLHRFSGGQGPVLTAGDVADFPPGWHTVDIIARGGHIEVALDGQTALKYDDPEPLGPGTVAFENGDPPARNQVDDVLIETAGP